MGEDTSNVLALRWAFGFSREAGVHNLCDENRSALFYASAHTGVIYDLNSKTQRLLQGHCNQISCTCVSPDRRYLATADRGADSMLVLWDSYTGNPVRSISNPRRMPLFLRLSGDDTLLRTDRDGSFNRTG